MNNSLIALLRALGLFVLLAVLGFFADASHLQGLVTPQTAAIIAALAVALEGVFSPKGTALFGAVRHS